MDFKTWLPSDYYNYDDLNRVESNSEEVASLVAYFKGYVSEMEYITNRDPTSIEFADSLNRIENNIKALIEELNNPTGTVEPKIYWQYNMPFDYQDANRLENNLLILYKYVTGNINNFKYCGVHTCGDEGVI